LLTGLAAIMAGVRGPEVLMPSLYLLFAAIFAPGGYLFGWIYYRWGSLWPAIGLHGCMNLWWDVMRVDRPTVFNLDLPSIAQGLSMLLALLLTLRASSSRTLLTQKLEARS
jgi:membrane protease YdiL (CAAX protease family)